MQLTTEQQAVLAHVVVDPAGWANHVEATFGTAKAGEMVAAKVARLQAAYDAEKDLPGYKSAAEKAATPPPLDDAKTERMRQVDGMLLDRFASGFTWNSNVFDGDFQAQHNVSAIAAGIGAGQGLPGGGATFTYWDRANVGHNFDSAAFLAFGAGLRDWATAQRVAARAHKDAILLLSDHASVAAYDISTGWPA